MIKDKMNKSLISNLEGVVEERYLDLFKIHSNNIVFVSNPINGFRDVLGLKSEAATFSLLESDFIMIDFEYMNGESEEDEMERIYESQAKTEVYQRTKQFLETEDRILYVFVEQLNLIEKEELEIAKNILSDSNLTNKEKTDKLLVFSDEYKEHSLQSGEDAANLTHRIEKELKENITYEDAIKLKNIILKNNPKNYAEESSDKVLCAVLNEIIIDKELSIEE